MKKTFLATLLTASLAGALLAGCSSSASSAVTVSSAAASSQTAADETGVHEIPLTYSFLYDDATKNEVRGILMEDGVPEEQIHQFLTIVTQFTDTLGDMKGAHEGFTTTNAAEQFYDSDYIGETFSTKLGFNDQNCRLTAFSLFRSFYEVSADSDFEDTKDTLYGDMEILKDNPNLKYTDEEIRKYKALFADVTVSNTMDPQALADSVKTTWSERGITFTEQTKVSLASIMMHDAASDSVFAGHAGVVFQTESGYLLLEKLSQYTPFVAGKFDNLEDLRTYMLSETAFLGSYANSAEPFIMLNDTLLT